MQLVDAYLSIPYVETKCGYACSDQYVSCCTSLFHAKLRTIVLLGARLDILPSSPLVISFQLGYAILLNVL